MAGNVENLIRPKRDRTAEERRASASKAGKASGAARRKKRDMMETARRFLEMPLKEGDLEEATVFEGAGKKNMTVMEAAILVQAKKAIEGDTRALEFIRDTAGMRPSDKVEVSGDVESASREIGAMIAALKGKENGES